ncbi:MAG: glycosyltransferase family 39 protein [Anaerolineae bacterium]|nr:glycosyltransferase family 39 protein [Anaerolineae bacterium]
MNRSNTAAPSSTTISLHDFWARERHQILALTLITLLAAALRFYQIGAWSFWSDEWFTVSGLEDGFNYNWLRQSLASTLVQAWVAHKGITEANARFFPALIGALTIPVFYMAIRRLLTPRIALLSALLLAVSPWHLFWSQNARFYTLLLLFFTLAWVCFHIGYEEKSNGFLLLSALFLALATRESLLALLLIPCVLLYVVMHWVGENRNLSLRTDLRLLLLLPLLGVALLFAWPYVSNLSDWMEGFGFANNTPFRFAASVAFYLNVPIVVLALVGSAHGIVTQRPIALWLSLIAFMPVLLLTLLTPFHYVANRYAFITLTSWIVLAAAALDSMATALQTDKQRRLLLLGLIALPVVQAMSDNALYFREQHGNRSDWRSGMAVIAEQAQPTDHIFSSDFKLASYYLDRPSGPIQALQLAALPESPVPVWLAVDATVAEAFPEVEAWFGRNGRLIDSFDVHVTGRSYPMRIYRYVPPDS